MIYHQSVTGGYCRVGATMARWLLKTYPLGVSSHVSTACTLNAVRCGQWVGVTVDEQRIRLEIVRLLMHVTRRSIQSLANEVGCTRTHMSLVLNGKRNFTEWMSKRCLDAIQFDTEEARELVGLAGFITKSHRWLTLRFRYLAFCSCRCAFACELHDL